MKKTAVSLIFVIIIILVIALFPKKKEYSRSVAGALGTVSTITIYDDNEKALNRCIDYINTADKLFSAKNPESEIYKLNNLRTSALSADTLELLNSAIFYADKDNFNPFLGSLINLWEDCKNNNTLPDQNEISQLKNSGFSVSLEIANNTASFLNPSQKVDLGAIAKGYITNKLINILDEEDVDSSLIYLGGNIYAKGKKPDKSPWKIGIQNPDDDSKYIGILSLSDTAVITSGDYQRYFEINGEKYHHILDPKTGFPAKSGLRSVTIVIKDALLGDVLSTKCFIEGLHQSRDILKEYGASAIFITDDNKVFYSKELENVFEINDSSYEYFTF